MIGRRKIEEGVKAKDGEVRVRRDNGRVKVTWPCDGEREFETAKLEQAIAHVELFAKYPGVWVDLKDSHGNGFVARLDPGGDFFAADRPWDEQATNAVKWSDLKDALGEAVAR